MKAVVGLPVPMKVYIPVPLDELPPIKLLVMVNPLAAFAILPVFGVIHNARLAAVLVPKVNTVV